MAYTIKYGDLWLQGFSKYGCIYASDKRDAIHFYDINVFNPILNHINGKIIQLEEELKNE